MEVETVLTLRCPSGRNRGHTQRPHDREVEVGPLRHGVVAMYCPDHSDAQRIKTGAGDGDAVE